MELRYTRVGALTRRFFGLFEYSEIEKNFQLGMNFLKDNRIKGDYVEFGVYKGYSMGVANFFAKKHGLNMVFYGFDSFQGLPMPKKEDENYFWKEGDYSSTIEETKKNLKKNKINDFKLIKGWYNETFKKNHGIKKIAFVHIDCDFYSSTKLVLDYIKPYLQNGTIILFDDWYTFMGNYEYGEKRAFEEFKKKNKNIEFHEIPCYALRKMFYCVLKNK